MIIVGSARCDENGKYVNGVAGDQTGKEVMEQNFYVHSKGWKILRPMTDSLANGLARAMQIACNNPNIGYDQIQRLDIITDGIESTRPTECDCSSLVRACLRYCGLEVNNFTTENESNILQRSGVFEYAGLYVSQNTTPIYNGDVLVTKTKGHTVVVTQGSPRPTIEYYPKYTGYSVSIVDALKAVGEEDTSMAHRKQIAFANGIIDGYKGTSIQNNTLLSKLKVGKLKKA